MKILRTILKKAILDFEKNYFFKIANIIIRERRARSPFSPNKFTTPEKLAKIFPKTGVSGPKIKLNSNEIAINKPSTSVDLYKNFLIFLNLNVSIF